MSETCAAPRPGPRRISLVAPDHCDAGEQFADSEEATSSESAVVATLCRRTPRRAWEPPDGFSPSRVPAHTGTRGFATRRCRCRPQFWTAVASEARHRFPDAPFAAVRELRASARHW